MRSIKLMDKSLAEKIAAGEVVERPGSIVKELCENSIDADSTAITIEIKNGGISYIRITDNGSGIPADEVRLAFERHSTSKMYSLDELEQIAFLGFRGEALASIAAVSELCMTTKIKQSDIGTQIELAGGDVTSLHEIGCPCGTSITVKNLFYNTPARRKFLKKPSAEAAYIGDIVSRLILAYPAISFKYIQDGRTVLHSPGSNDLSDAVISVYGRFVSQNMLRVSDEVNGIKLSGLIGNSELEKNNKSYQSIFINGRYVKDRIVSSAVLAGYLNNITVGKFPMFIMFLEMDGSYVDVNVHPNKLEVRFSDEKLIYDTIRNAVAKVLATKNEIPALLQDPKEDFEEPVSYKVSSTSPYRINDSINVTVDKSDFVDILKPDIEIKPLKASDCIGTSNAVVNTDIADSFSKDTVYSTKNDSDVRIDQVNEATKTTSHILDEARIPVKDNIEDPDPEQLKLESNNEDLQAKSIFTDYRLIGQAFATYVLVENEDTLYLIDQHAAHERLLYERLVKNVESGKAVSQTLLTPQKLNLNFAERAKLISILDELKLLGFELDEFGDNEYLVRSVPILLDGPCGVELIYEILGDFERLRSCQAVEIKRQRLMQIACKHAIKAGDKLLPEELDSIMEMIRREKVPLSCPHGRPILVCLTKKELELRFKRIQS